MIGLLHLVELDGLVVGSRDDAPVVSENDGTRHNLGVADQTPYRYVSIGIPHSHSSVLCCTHVALVVSGNLDVPDEIEVVPSKPHLSQSFICVSEFAKSEVLVGGQQLFGTVSEKPRRVNNLRHNQPLLVSWKHTHIILHSMVEQPSAVVEVVAFKT